MDFFVRFNETFDSRGSTVTSQDFSAEEEALREDLRYYFMSPCEKYRMRRKVPWKLGVQILKIIMVTTQLVLFGLNNQLVISYKEENSMTFKNLFLKGYTGTDEDDYSRAVYSQQDVYDCVFFAIDQYALLKNLSVGPVSYAQDDSEVSPLVICKQHYRRGSVHSSYESNDIDPETETVCLTLDIKTIEDKEWKMANASFFNLDFYRLVNLRISFRLNGINLQTIRSHELPDCYEFFITITFDNQGHSGKMKVYFDSEAISIACKNCKNIGTVQKNKRYLLVFDVFVIVTCLTSAVLCTRSIVLAIKLLQSLTSYDVCSIFLGTSTLLVWVGVIRYLGYFQKYNVLILTMRAAFPKVLRFCCCAGMIYLGYTFCGWIVLGPYHEKFEGLSRVAECLFSLVNGDDMFATFAQFQEKSTLVWLFSRVYLYSFISLFIYMVLSLFIALITDSYETIKNYQENGFPMTDLQRFLKRYRDFPSSESCKEQEAKCSFVCCCNRLEGDEDVLLIS
uniref:Mucolipin TRP cation channel 2 n=1 Tax=Lepisosteus oculatus TaxID=7918 RepID=W5ME93_LEPOC